MKRILNSILISFIVFTLSACGETGQEMPFSENIDIPETESIESGENSGKDNMFNENKADTENENRIPNSSVFNFDTKSVILNSGYEMPIYGIGTYSLTGDTCVESVTTALNKGVRLIDTAYMYHNEESVGQAVRNSDIPREEISDTVSASLINSHAIQPAKTSNTRMNRKVNSSPYVLAVYLSVHPFIVAGGIIICDQWYHSLTKSRSHIVRQHFHLLYDPDGSNIGEHCSYSRACHLLSFREDNEHEERI